MPASRRRFGVTLVELVMAAAGLLVVLLVVVPVYSRSQEPFRRETCQSQLRRLVGAFLIYAEDNDSRLPGYEEMITRLSGQHHSGTIWYESISAYVRETRLLHCPSKKRSLDPRTSYAYNAWLSGIPPFSLTSIQTSPRDVPVLGDGANSLTEFAFLHVPGFMPIPESGAHSSDVIAAWAYANKCGAGSFEACHRSAGAPRPPIHRGRVDQKIENTRHNGGSNLAFLDGHVKFFPAHEIRYDRFDLCGHGVMKPF